MAPKQRISDRAILDAIQAYTATHRYPPSLRELAARVGFRSTCGTAYRLEQLRDQGRVTWQRGEARTLRVIEEVA